VGVIRPELPGDGYAQVPNRWMRDERLSWKAKGLLAYLLGHAAGFRVSQNLMQRQATDGRDSLLSGLAELEHAGYLVRSGRQRGEGGKYTEEDYVLTDPGDPSRSAPNRAGDPTSAGNPQRLTHGGSPASKKTRGKNKGTPTESRVEEEARQLALVDDRPLSAADRKRVLGSVAAAVTREHVDACGGMANYLALLGIVKRALDVPADGQGSAAAMGKPPRYDDERVRKALAVLRGAGRPVTLQTLHATLEAPAGDPRTVTSNGYRAGGYGPRAQIPTDPDAFRGGL
jgi:hypothetical protein